MALQFWFEFASTYTYPAAMRIEEAARLARVELEYHPFLLGPIFASQGWSDSPFNLYPVKGRYMWRDLGRICDDLRCRFGDRRCSHARSSAVRVASVDGRNMGREFCVFIANFAEDRDT